MIQLTYRCNFNCLHCAYGDMKASPIISLNKVKEFLGKYSPRLIKLSGGEPTLCKNFEEIVSLSKQTGAKVISFTNGSFSPKKNPDAYWVSLYGSEVIHNYLTNGNHWKRTIKFIKTHNVEYLNSPVFSFRQMKSLRKISEELEIPLRITQLLRHGYGTWALPLRSQQEIVRVLDLNRKPNWITCSLGFEPPRCNKKMCLKPDGTEIICTYLIRGLRCPFEKKTKRRTKVYES